MSVQSARDGAFCRGQVNFPVVRKLKVVMTMTEAATPDRVMKKLKRDKARMVADDIVTAYSLATHLGMSRQNVALLTANAVIGQRSDGCYDQIASRLKYIKHLREQHRRSPHVEADAKHAEAKTEMLQLRLMEKKRELVRRADVDALIAASAAWC
jgi:hypothetical protein